MFYVLPSVTMSVTLYCYSNGLSIMEELFAYSQSHIIFYSDIALWGRVPRAFELRELEQPMVKFDLCLPNPFHFFIYTGQNRISSPSPSLLLLALLPHPLPSFLFLSSSLSHSSFLAFLLTLFISVSIHVTLTSHFTLTHDSLLSLSLYNFVNILLIW